MKKILLLLVLVTTSYTAKCQNSPKPSVLSNRDLSLIYDNAKQVPGLKRDIRDLQGIVKEKNSVIHTLKLNLDQSAKRDSLHHSIVQSIRQEGEAQKMGYLAETTALKKDNKKHKRGKTFWKIVSGALAAALGYVAFK